MKYQAVIFDLFGTLIENFTIERHESVLKQMASVLSAPSEEFVRLWYETFDDRCLGILKTPEDNIAHVCRKLRLAIEDDQRKKAARIRLDLTVNSMVPISGAIDTLTWLKTEGFKTGLVTDCSAEVPAIWRDTPFAPLFDTTVFSCLAGLKKPDPRIYKLAAEQLAVKPEDCLYIGDGSSNELTGAATVGMHPVLIHDPEEASGIVHRVEYEADRWNGPAITSLKEVLELVE
ncbi:MAG: HAD-IA family hydrolase [Dehalococcoidales bacterium]